MRGTLVVLAASALACGSRNVWITPPGDGESLVVVVESGATPESLSQAWAFDRPSSWKLEVELDAEAAFLTVASYDRSLADLGLPTGSLSLSEAGSFSRTLPTDALSFHQSSADAPADWRPLDGPSDGFLASRLAVSVAECVGYGGCILDDPNHCDIPCEAPLPPALPIHAAMIDDRFAPTPPTPPSFLPCPLGWVMARDEGCVPPSPAAAACPVGEGRFFGEVSCRSVASPCPGGPWPTNLPPGPVRYVREGAVGGDGSLVTPFGDLTAALAGAGPGVVLALAAGRYALPAGVWPSFTVRGRCAADVVVELPTGVSSQIADLDFGDLTFGPGTLRQASGSLIVRRVDLAGVGIVGDAAASISIDATRIDRLLTALGPLTLRSSALVGDGAIDAAHLVIDRVSFDHACGLTAGSVTLSDVSVEAPAPLGPSCAHSGVEIEGPSTVERLSIRGAAPVCLLIAGDAVVHDLYLDGCQGAGLVVSGGESTITRLHRSVDLEVGTLARLRIDDASVAGAAIRAGARLELHRAHTGAMTVDGSTLSASDLTIDGGAGVGLRCSNLARCWGERIFTMGSGSSVEARGASVAQLFDATLTATYPGASAIGGSRLSLARVSVVPGEISVTTTVAQALYASGIDTRLELSTLKIADLPGQGIVLDDNARAFLEDAWIGRLPGAAVSASNFVEVELRRARIEHIGGFDGCSLYYSVLISEFSRLTASDVTFDDLSAYGVVVTKESSASLDDVTFTRLANSALFVRDSELTGQRVAIDRVGGAAIYVRRDNGIADLTDLTLQNGVPLADTCSEAIEATAFFPDLLGTITVRSFVVRGFSYGVQTAGTAGLVELQRGRVEDVGTLLGPAWSGFNRASLIYRVVFEGLGAFERP